METALAPLTGEIQLSDSEIAQLVANEMRTDRESNAFQFVPSRVKMPSGSPPYAFGLGDEIVKEVTGVIIVSQSARAYWATKETQGLPPVCSSADGLVGWLADSIDEEQLNAAMLQRPVHLGLRAANAERGPYACNRCPLAEWGTGSGRGQACKSLRRQLVKIEGWAMPVILTLPPTSVKIFDDFASARQSKGKAYFSCSVKISLEPKTNAGGVKYAAVKLTRLEELPADELSIVLSLRSQFAELVRNMAITAQEYEVAPEETHPF